MNSAEQYLKLQMRVCVLELHLAALFAATAHLANATPDQLAEVLKRGAAAHQQVFFAGLDPAMSDLLSDEWAIAMDRLAAIEIAVAQGVPAPKSQGND